MQITVRSGVFMNIIFLDIDKLIPTRGSKKITAAIGIMKGHSLKSSGEENIVEVMENTRYIKMPKTNFSWWVFHAIFDKIWMMAKPEKNGAIPTRIPLNPSAFS